MKRFYVCLKCGAMVTKSELQDHKLNGCSKVLDESEETKSYNDIFAMEETENDVNKELEIDQEKPKRKRRTKQEIEADKLKELEND